MDEERKKSTDKNILHIYPSKEEFKRTVEEHYVLDFGNSKRDSGFKLKAKKVMNTCKKQLSSTSRKHPRTTREHTDFDKHPYKMTCPNCLSYIITDVYSYSTRATHSAAATLSPVCMCIVPYCTKKFKNVAHYCPRCSIYLGTKFASRKKIFCC